MKIILTIMCALVILFSGGCALMLFGISSSGGGMQGLALLGLLPAAVALLNLFVIGGLYGWGLRWRPAFYILGIIDLLIAAYAMLAFGVVALNVSGLPVGLSLLQTLLFGLKGILTLQFARGEHNR